jgi:4-hydroxy-2-oxoheptanedioate aldolase
MQHGVIGYEQMVSMLQGVDARGIPTMVRVPWNEPASIMRALDAGAAGVIVPMVNSAAEATAASRASRYPPLGVRSWGPARAALGNSWYGPEAANGRVVCVPMIETPEGVANAEEIVAVPGVDGILIGPYDLSLSSSFTVETPGRKPADLEQINRVLAACKREGIVAGIACGTADDVDHWRANGFGMFQLNSDLGLLSLAATAIVADARRRLEVESG